MKKAMMVAALALACATPAMANLLSDSWNQYDAGWGSVSTWNPKNATTAHENGTPGSHVLWQLVTVPANGDYTLTGDVSGSAGWIEVMFRVNPGYTPAQISSGIGIDTDDVQFINKHEGSIGGSLAIGPNPGWSHTASSNVVSATAGQQLLVGIKAGNSSGVNFDNLNLTPEPATMALLGLPALAIFRRRRHA